MPSGVVLDAGRFAFQSLSVILLVFLIWSPRYPVFAMAIAAGLGRSLWADPTDASQYLWWDAPTTTLRLLACAEAFWLRTEDVTRRWLLLALCVSVAAFVAALLALAPVRESIISDYNHARMMGYYAAAGFLGALVVYASFVPLAPAYRRDHAHLVLLALFCLTLGFSGSVPMPMTKAGYLRWELVAGLSYWMADGLLLAWLVLIGHILVAKQIGQKFLGICRAGLKRLHSTP